MTTDTVSAPSSTTVVAPWRLRFWTIWTSQAFSLIGSALTQFVLIWWVTQTTGSARALALAGMMALLSQALLGPLGGTLADRFSRRALLILADAVSAVCMLVLIWLFQSDAVQLWHVCTMMVIRSAMQAFQQPAAAASVTMLVPAEWIGRVAGLNQSLGGLMLIAAPALGALALALFPFGGALLIDVVTALLAVSLLCLFRIPQPARDATQSTNIWGDFVAGVRLVARHRGLLLLYVVVTLIVLLVIPINSLTPLFVSTHFDGGVRQVALLQAAGGVGLIAGGVLTIGITVRRKVVLLLTAYGLACTLIAAMALTPSSLFWLAVVVWALGAAAFSAGNATLFAMLQSRVPNEFQGRVIALLTTIMGVAGPLGLGVVALLGTQVSAREVFMVGGGAAAVVCLLACAAPNLMCIEDTPIVAHE